MSWMRLDGYSFVDGVWHEPGCMAPYDGRCICDTRAAEAEIAEILYERDRDLSEDAARDRRWDA